MSLSLFSMKAQCFVSNTLIHYCSLTGRCSPKRFKPWLMNVIMLYVSGKKIKWLKLGWKIVLPMGQERGQYRTALLHKNAKERQVALPCFRFYLSLKSLTCWRLYLVKPLFAYSRKFSWTLLWVDNNSTVFFCRPKQNNDKKDNKKKSNEWSLSNLQIGLTYL